MDDKGRTAFFAAGASAACITPGDEHLVGGDLFLGGFGSYKSRGAATGVHDQVSARAVAIQVVDNLKPYPEETGGLWPAVAAVLISVDTIGLGTRVVKRIRQAVSQQTGLTPGQILVSSTHTHSGPDLLGLWGGVSPAYLEHLISQSVWAAVSAWTSRTPAELAVGAIRLPGANRNRRGWETADEVLIAAQLKRGDGSVIATLINYAVHPVIIGSRNRLVASDYVGPLLQAVQSRYGGMALSLAGSLGDASPKRPDAPNPFLQASRYGELIAEGVTQAIEGAWPVPPALHVVTRAVPFVLENDALLRAYQAGWLEPYYDAETSSGKTELSTEVVRVSLGAGEHTLEIVCVPGEALTRLGTALAAIMGGKHQMVVSLTPTAAGYLIPDDEWMVGRNNNYEESVALDPAAGPKVLDAALHLFTDA